MLNSTKTWKEEKLDELVRDLCSVEFRVKSATRKRLEQFISDLISQTREETIRDVEDIINNEYIIKDLYKSSNDLLNDIKKSLNKLKK